MKKYSIRFVAVLALAVVLFGLLPATAVAGGKVVGHGSRTPATSASLSVAPNPVVAGNAFEITGAGFTANAMVVVGVPGYIPFGQVYTDSAGVFSYTYTRYLQPWTYPVQAYQQKGKSWVLKGSCTVTVLAP